MIFNKKKTIYGIVDIPVPATRECKFLKNSKRNMYLKLAREVFKKAMENEGNCATNCKRCVWNEPQRLVKAARRVENERTNLNYPNYSIVKISQNT